jgi:hypothetical protein
MIRKNPSTQKIISVVIIDWNRFATNLIKNEVPLGGMELCGDLAAASFTTTMFTANRVAIEISSANVVYICYWGRSDSLFIFGSNTNCPI